MEHFYIHPDITQAETLPASFYRSQEVFDAIKERVFKSTWQWIGDANSCIPLTESVFPFVLLDNYLTEPMMVVRDKENKILCLSNVCTHRGNIVAHHPGKMRSFTCMYHGRRFDLDGTFKSMPEFEKAKDFPRPCDSLHTFELREWGSHLFVGLHPVFDFSEVIEVMKERVGFLPLNEFKLDTSLNKDYIVNCHWALYCDNYLEGFHIPFVHEDLNDALDYGQYKTEVYEHVNLQIGYSGSGEEVFKLPEGHPDQGKHVAAYYYWVFPNIMFNFYPWGLSVNIVKPINIHKTKVSFITYVYDETKLHTGAGALLDKVEREDEFVVEGVHKGLQSKFYKAGRFSPTREKGVHHFHSLLAKYLNT
ncbi:aromatic ring-hydroxylating dioxygenase subunit alpha [uncultured Dokdonia sp.]|uniref:aromatic ring-hydroxylating oxygenase subunit alpha n=1 Tax=uncultured Dokdonia sp. TaxID=575653 RepID=UPI002607AA7F|nr:aromatic ring-hydroxylating dioxygenase subunit alpha [uncultured Dokdonia sp.]